MRLRRPFVVASAVAACLAYPALAAATGALASPTNTPAAGPWSLAPGEYYSEVSGSAFTAASDYDDGGHRVLLPTTLQQRAARWYSELGWKKRWSVSFELPMISNAVRSGPVASESQAGFEDFGFGLRYRLHNGASASALQLGWEAPMGYNYRLDVPPGDGLQKLSASLQFGGPAGRGGFWQLGAGYRYDYLTIGGRAKAPADAAAPTADQDWSDHVTLNAAYALWLGHLQVAGLYGGDLPLNTGRPEKVTQHAVGPRFTYRVDERLDVFAGSWHTPAGKNDLHVDEFYAGLAFKSTKLNRLQGFLGNDSRP